MGDPRDCDHLGQASSGIEGDYLVTTCGKCGATLNRQKL
jgi:hypothetical protein